MHILLLALISSFFTSVLVSGRSCDPSDPLIKFMRELKGARKECASYLGEETTRTVFTTTSVDSDPTTLSTEIDRETTLGSLDVARITNTVKHTETKTVTSAVYDSTSYSTVIVTVTSAPSPQTRTSTTFQTITSVGTTIYYTVTITIFRTTATATTLPSAATTGVLITTRVTSIVTARGKPSSATSARSSLIVPSGYSTKTIMASSLLPSMHLVSVKSTKATSTRSGHISTVSDYFTETITPSSLLSSAPLISTNLTFTTITGSNLTSTPLWNNATGTGRASSLLSSPISVTMGSTMTASITPSSVSPGLGSYTTETSTAPVLPSAPSTSSPFSTATTSIPHSSAPISSTFIPPVSVASIPSTFIPPITVAPGSSTRSSVPSQGCTVYTTTITRSSLLHPPSNTPSTFLTLGSTYNTSISTKTTNTSAPFTLSPLPSPYPPTRPTPVINRWRRFEVPKSLSTAFSNSWLSHTDAIMTAAPIIPENGLDTVRLYDRRPGDTSSACSCIMPYLISQPHVTKVVTETIPPRMIWVTNTKVFTKIRIDGTTTLTSAIVQQTTKYVTKFHTKVKEAITTKSIAAPGIAGSTAVVTVTRTTTVRMPVTSTIAQYATIDI